MYKSKLIKNLNHPLSPKEITKIELMLLSFSSLLKRDIW